VSDVVLDDSVSMGWLMPTLKLQDQQYADTVLKSMADATAIVPNLWRLEVANVLLASEKRQQLDIRASLDKDLLKAAASVGVPLYLC